MLKHLGEPRLQLSTCSLATGARRPVEDLQNLDEEAGHMVPDRFHMKSEANSNPLVAQAGHQKVKDLSPALF
jgi:hypothetical protein